MVLWGVSRKILCCKPHLQHSIFSLRSANGLSNKHALQLVGLVNRDEIINKLINISVEDAGQVVAAQTDAVIGHAILREVVGANLLAAIARLHLGAASLAQFFLAFGLL